MPDPIPPVASHGQRITDPALAQTLLTQLAQKPPLTDDDFAFLMQTAIESKAGAEKVKTFLDSNNVSLPERNAFYTYVGQQVKPDAQHRTDANLASVGSFTVSPEDVMLAGGGALAAVKATPTVLGAVKGAVQGAAPIAKYEAAKYGLEKIGIPPVPASLIAAGVTGYRRGASAAAEESPRMTREDIRAEAQRYGVRVQPEHTPQIVRGPDGRAVVERPPFVPPSGPPPAEPVAPVATAPTPAPPIANPPPAAPAAAPSNTLTFPPTPFNPAESFKAVRAQFDQIGVKPLSAELTNAMEFMRRGLSAEDAVAKVIAKRPPMPEPVRSAVEELAAKLAGKGAVSDDEVIASVTAKNARASRAKGGTK